MMNTVCFLFVYLVFIFEFISLYLVSQTFLDVSVILGGIGIIGFTACIKRFNPVLVLFCASYILFSIRAFRSLTWMSFTMNVELVTLTSCFIVFMLKKQRCLKHFFHFFFFNILASSLMMLGFLTSPFGFNDAIQSFVLPSGALMQGGILYAMGLCIKGGILFFASWVVMTYTQIPPMGAFFLSSCTTKVALYGLAKGFSSYLPLSFFGFLSFLFFGFCSYCSYKGSLHKTIVLSLLSKIGLLSFFVGVTQSHESIISIIAVHILYSSSIFLLLDGCVESTPQNPNRMQRNKLSPVLFFLLVTVIAIHALGLPGFIAFKEKKVLIEQFLDNPINVDYYGFFVYVILFFIKFLQSDIAVLLSLYSKRKNFYLKSISFTLAAVFMLAFSFLVTFDSYYKVDFLNSFRSFAGIVLSFLFFLFIRITYSILCRLNLRHRIGFSYANLLVHMYNNFFIYTRKILEQLSYYIDLIVSYIHNVSRFFVYSYLLEKKILFNNVLFFIYFVCFSYFCFFIYFLI